MIHIDNNEPLNRAEVIDSVKKCVKVMMADIQREINKCSHVYLVALSRKMPRLLKRVLRDIDSETKQEYVKILERCTLASEHALPMLFRSEVKEGTKVIILDDIIISGTTLSVTAKDVNYFAGVRPDVMALYVYEGAVWPDGVESVEILSEKALPLKVCQTYLSIISSYIADGELPIDLEFPVFNIKGVEDIEKFKGEVTQFFPGHVIYSLPSADSPLYRYLYPDMTARFQTSLNILLFSKLHTSSNVDFAKFRFFFPLCTLGKEDTRLAVFYPHIFTMYDMKDRELFQTPIYREIWNLLLDSVYSTVEESLPRKRYRREGLDNDTLRREHTLMVMANWLYSLALMVKVFGEAGPHGSGEAPFSLDSVTVSAKELELLVGPTLGRIISGKANEILRRRILEPISERSSCDIPESKLPRHKIDTFAISQIGIVQSSDSAGQALTRIFEAINGIRKNSIEKGRIFYEGEPLIALHQVLKNLKLKFDSGKLEEEFHKWLDTGIDLGLIVPKYTPTSFGYLRRSWSRQFAPSHFF